MLTESDNKHFIMILGDERRYLQILVNFLSNALKFSSKKSKICVQLKVNECIERQEKNKINKKVQNDLTA